MARTIFRSARIWTGLEARYHNGDVLVEDQRIVAISRDQRALEVEDAQEIECNGLTLMPGLVEGHAHLSFGEVDRTTDLGELPPEEHLLLTMRNAQLLLDQGFTSAYSAASAKLRLDIAIRNEINSGRLVGPRIRAAGPEITVTAGLGDENLAHMARSSFALVADGPAEIVKAVRLCVREGVDNVKIVISGDDTAGAKASMTVMSEEEVRAAAETAHSFQRRVNCHARSSESVKRALKFGVDVIYHCEYADQETLDLLEAAKDRVFVGPAVGPIYVGLHEAQGCGFTNENARSVGFDSTLEACQHTYQQIRRRGVRVVIGGDYGLSRWAPQGTNARDIEHFVKLFGYSPCAALQCATQIGGEIMGMGHELGLVKEGYLADLLLVSGDPLTDVSVLQNRKNLVAIMKGGHLHKNAVKS